jgi:hypothetical protein
LDEELDVETNSKRARSLKTTEIPVGDVNSPLRAIDRLLDIKYAKEDQPEDLYLVKFKYCSFGNDKLLT